MTDLLIVLGSWVGGWVYGLIGIRLMFVWDDDLDTRLWVWAWPLVLVVILGAWVCGAERAPVEKRETYRSMWKGLMDFFRDH